MGKKSAPSATETAASESGATALPASGRTRPGTSQAISTALSKPPTAATARLQGRTKTAPSPTDASKPDRASPEAKSTQDTTKRSASRPTAAISAPETEAAAPTKPSRGSAPAAAFTTRAAKDQARGPSDKDGRKPRKGDEKTKDTASAISTSDTKASKGGKSSALPTSAAPPKSKAGTPRPELGEYADSKLENFFNWLEPNITQVAKNGRLMRRLNELVTRANTSVFDTAFGTRTERSNVSSASQAKVAQAEPSGNKKHRARPSTLTALGSKVDGKGAARPKSKPKPTDTSTPASTAPSARSGRSATTASTKAEMTSNQASAAPSSNGTPSKTPSAQSRIGRSERPKTDKRKESRTASAPASENGTAPTIDATKTTKASKTSKPSDGQKETTSVPKQAPNDATATRKRRSSKNRSESERSTAQSDGAKK